MTVEEYIAGSHGLDFTRRVRFTRIAGNFPPALRKPLVKSIWAGPWRHLKNFDHSLGFERRGTDLVSMGEYGSPMAHFTPLSKLIGKIDRPVTIVTLGPSARDHDWKAVKDSGRMIVAVSGGATFLKERGIAPDLLVVSDPDFGKTAGYHLTGAPRVPLVLEYRVAAALHRHFPDTLENRPAALVERVNKWFGAPALHPCELAESNRISGSPFRISETPDPLLRIGWSDQPGLAIFPSATVAFVALQIVVAHGATDIDIIGMDLGGGKSLYADVGASRLEQEYHHVILPSFREMALALAGRNVRISNLSPLCPLPPEIFPHRP